MPQAESRSAALVFHGLLLPATKPPADLSRISRASRYATPGSFTEAHILAITQAICDYRRSQGNADTAHQDDFVLPYVNDLRNVVDMEAIHGAGLALAVDPLGGAAAAMPCTNFPRHAFADRQSLSRAIRRRGAALLSDTEGIGRGSLQ
jgi:hypothetical protein